MSKLRGFLDTKQKNLTDEIFAVNGDILNAILVLN